MLTKAFFLAFHSTKHIDEYNEKQPHPYETNRTAADLQQICFTKTRLVADYFIVCKVCFQSVADALPSSSNEQTNHL